MMTVLEECTTEEQRSIVRFCRQKNLTLKILIKKYFLFTMGSVRRIKRYTTGSRNSRKLESRK
jgi:hypothetical protein